jgi:hypothetical protein
VEYWKGQRERLNGTIQEGGAEPRKMHEMMSLEFAKQRREELLREAELRRRAKALRAARKPRDVRRSALVWEMKRYAGGLLKVLKSSLRNTGG